MSGSSVCHVTTNSPSGSAATRGLRLTPSDVLEMVNTEPSGTPVALTSCASTLLLSSFDKTTMKRPSVRAATSGEEQNPPRVGDGDLSGEARAVEEPRLDVQVVAASLRVNNQGIVPEGGNRCTVLVVCAIVDEFRRRQVGLPPLHQPEADVEVAVVLGGDDQRAPVGQGGDIGPEPGVAVEGVLLGSYGSCARDDLVVDFIGGGTAVVVVPNDDGGAAQPGWTAGSAEVGGELDHQLSRQGPIGASTSSDAIRIQVIVFEGDEEAAIGQDRDVGIELVVGSDLAKDRMTLFPTGEKLLAICKVLRR